MAAAVPIVGAIIVSVVVSEAVKAIGPKLGFSDTMVGIGATIAGAYAGGMTYSSAMATTAGAGVESAGGGMDLALDTSTADLSAAGSNVAPSGAGGAGLGLDPNSFNLAASAPTAVPAAPAAAAGGVTTPPLTVGAAPGADTALGGGMLSRAAAPTAAVPKAATTASRVTDTAGEKSWYEKLFTPEKTMDLIMAGMTGYSEAGMAEEEREYPEKIAKQNAKDWSKAYPGMLSLSQQYPSQQ